ncbi:Clp protease N-terminal domain-containing protein [Streptomyces sp. NPDC101237]|uniref:Clp protease N-terminal domain-containing protein n=1 Tax=Streptomyces sp. NPDC101237 TaxID=3366139 RepID=UPI0037F813F5
MYERFSDRARDVADLARGQARALRHWYVEPGHVLLALLDDDASEVVRQLGAPAEELRAALAEALGGGTVEPGEYLPLSGAAGGVFERAPREADRLGHRIVQPFHVLLALLATADPVLTDVLARTRVDPERPRTPLTPPAATALLDSLTRDPAAGAPPVVGRAAEIDRVLRVLTRRDRRIPLLTGAPGVGKEAVAVGVARAVEAGRAPDALLGRRVRALDLAAVLADPRHRARGTALVAGLLDEIADGTGLLLYLPGALTPLRLPEGTATPLGLLRPLLETPGVRAFGACTDAEYDRRDPDRGLDRLLQPVPLDEPPAADLPGILRAGRARLEEHHAVALTDEAFAAAAALARDHVPDRALPGSALALLDEAAALARTARAAADRDGPPAVTAAHVTEALAGAAGVRAPGRPAPPAGHDPYVWAMS